SSTLDMRGASLFSTGSLRKNGAGLLRLSGPTLGGRRLVNVNQGTLRFSGASGVASTITVSSGASLDLAGGTNAATPFSLDVNSISLQGTGTGAGALLASSGTNVLVGAATLVADATIGATSGAILRLPTSIDTGRNQLSLRAAAVG